MSRAGSLSRGVSMSGGGAVSGRETPPVNRMTDRCKSITLPQTSFAGGKYKYVAHYKGMDKDWWQELENKLKKFPLHQGELALALLYAVQGRADLSQKTYRSYTTMYVITKRETAVENNFK